MTAPRGGSSAAAVAHWGDRIFLLTAVPLGVSDDEVHQYRGALPERDVHQYLVLAIDRRDGTTIVIRHGKACEVLATNKLDDQFSASMALVGSEIYMRGDTYLYAIAEN